jgi:hypothetical protein
MSKTISRWCLVLGVALGIGLGCSSDTKQKDSSIPPKETGPKTCTATAYLPADGKLGDYKQQDLQIATNGKELDDLIDGGSEKFKDNKFSCLSWVKYASAGKAVSIDIRLFDQTDSGGATAAYGLVGTTYVDITPVIGDAAKDDTTLPTTYAAVMRKGKFLAQVTANKKDAQADATEVVKGIAAALP